VQAIQVLTDVGGFGGRVGKGDGLVEGRARLVFPPSCSRKAPFAPKK